MSEVRALITEAHDLLVAAEDAVIHHPDVEPDATQLRIVVNRLHMFADQHATAIEHATAPQEPESAAEAAAEPEPDEDLDALTRKQLNQKATDVGVDAPDKLATKAAVIAAIREMVSEPDPEPDAAEDDGEPEPDEGASETEE